MALLFSYVFLKSQLDVFLKMKIYRLLFFCALFLITIGCGKESYKFKDGCDLTDTGYNGNIKEIININCAYEGCHAGGTELDDFTTYQGVKALAGSLKDRINRNIDDALYMPQNKTKLSNCDLQKLNVWINKGAPLN